MRDASGSGQPPVYYFPPDAAYYEEHLTLSELARRATGGAKNLQKSTH